MEPPAYRRANTLLTVSSPTYLSDFSSALVPALKMRTNSSCCVLLEISISPSTLRTLGGGVESRAGIVTGASEGRSSSGTRTTMGEAASGAPGLPAPLLAGALLTEASPGASTPPRGGGVSERRNWAGAQSAGRGAGLPTASSETFAASSAAASALAAPASALVAPAGALRASKLLPSMTMQTSKPASATEKTVLFGARSLAQTMAASETLALTGAAQTPMALLSSSKRPKTMAAAAAIHSLVIESPAWQTPEASIIADLTA
mmetsp:Transcript_116093/g.333398  ORF Transcript_116093/g.333398 Transcript_116093/m.333398 type:complete len:262 (-) Transcript_116093:132-917(-)